MEANFAVESLYSKAATTATLHNDLTDPVLYNTYIGPPEQLLNIAIALNFPMSRSKRSPANKSDLMAVKR